MRALWGMVVAFRTLPLAKWPQWAWACSTYTLRCSQCGRFEGGRHACPERMA